MPLRAFDTVGLPALRALLVPGAAPPALHASEPASDGDPLPGLAALADDLAAAGHGLIMVMGKGGVGKTTIAAALAIGLVQALTPWSLSLNLTAWLQGGATYYVSVPCAELAGQEGEIGWCSTDRTLSAAHGGVLLTVVAAVLVLAGWLAFRRRDLD